MKCPKCQIELPIGANFCFRCGLNLQAIPVSKHEHPPESIRPHVISEPERKHVTTLFSDLTGYTFMTEKLAPEQVKEITGRFFTGVKEIIAKYEGFIERIMGDGVLAFFGVPRSHEDDPIRAIHAAMEIHKLVKSLSPQYEARIGAPLTMHSGISTGLVVTADVDPDRGTHGVAGDSVNVASRLSGLANPGEILVGHDTHVRAEGVFKFKDLGFKKVKGKAEPVHVFKVLSVKTGRGAARFDRQVSTEIEGRDKELDSFALQVMKAIHDEGSMVNVVGEAGIGQSRLMAELKESHIMKLNSETKFRLLTGALEQIAEGIAFADLDGRLLFSNCFFAEMHGYRAQELVGKHWANLCPAEEFLTLAAAIKETGRSGVFKGELVHCRDDGNLFPVFCISSLIRDGRGSPVGMIVTARDISDIKVAERIESYTKRRWSQYINDLEQQLRETVQQLQDSQAEQKNYTTLLEQTKEALKLLIDVTANRNREREQAVYRNLCANVLPILDQLKSDRLSDPVRLLVNSLEFELRSLFSLPAKAFFQEATPLTPHEMRLCELIRSGLTSKQIADVMGISSATVMVHRSNIRKKLRLVGSGDNLASYLRTRL